MPLVSGRERILENPFYVLGLRPECSRMDVEREGQKLLAMLELKLGAAATYATPLGKVERTPEKVRQAMAELREPTRRLEHEIWASMEPVPPTDTIDEGEAAPAPWMEGQPLAGGSAA